MSHPTVRPNDALDKVQIVGHPGVESRCYGGASEARRDDAHDRVHAVHLVEFVDERTPGVAFTGVGYQLLVYGAYQRPDDALLQDPNGDGQLRIG